MIIAHHTKRKEFDWLEPASPESRPLCYAGRRRVGGGYAGVVLTLGAQSFPGGIGYSDGQLEWAPQLGGALLPANFKDAKIAQIAWVTPGQSVDFRMILYPINGQPVPQSYIQSVSFTDSAGVQQQYFVGPGAYIINSDDNSTEWQWGPAPVPSFASGASVSVTIR